MDGRRILKNFIGRLERFIQGVFQQEYADLVAGEEDVQE